MGRQFDQEAEDFTLEKIIEWGFDQYAEKISDISGAATKEMAIEVGLKDIAETWEVTELDMAPYKDKGIFKLKYVYTQYVPSMCLPLTRFSRSLLLSYQKNALLAPAQPSLLCDTDYKIVLLCLHRLYSMFRAIPKEGFARIVSFLWYDKIKISRPVLS